MGSFFSTAIWKASATSPSVMEASPSEQTTTGGSSGVSWVMPACSLYHIPRAMPVVGMACMPVALLWCGILGISSRRRLGWP